MEETVDKKPAPEEKQEAPDLLLQNRTEFFIDELASYQRLQDSRYSNLNSRLAKLERDKKGFDDDDPTKAFVGMFVMIILINVAVPLLEGVIAKWRSQSSPSLPLP